MAFQACAKRFGVRPLAAAFCALTFCKKSGRERPHSKALRAKKANVSADIKIRCLALLGALWFRYLALFLAQFPMFRQEIVEWEESFAGPFRGPQIR